MGIHIQRDDGKWLVGGGATRVSAIKEHPWINLKAAMAAIDRYRLVSQIHNLPGKDQSFTLFHY